MKVTYSCPVPVAHPRPTTKRPHPDLRRVELASLVAVQPSLGPEELAVLAEDMGGGVPVWHPDDRALGNAVLDTGAVDEGRVPDGWAGPNK